MEANRGRVEPLPEETDRARRAAAGRVLTRALAARVDVPACDVSAMDGYAVTGEVPPAEPPPSPAPSPPAIRPASRFSPRPRSAS